jgi:hypothetical protein
MPFVDSNKALLLKGVSIERRMMEIFCFRSCVQEMRIKEREREYI